ncbi:MAG: GGDEF domain-containing protein [Lachnospiraceae bacterium]|nr:GGDEF domain-containing protein [Lachnospiraceae bacterium]
MTECKRKYKSPLYGRLLSGSLFFVILLCVIMGISGYFLFKDRMMSQYRSHLNSILKFTNDIINVDNLKTVTETFDRNEYYELLVNLFDSARREYDLEDIVMGLPVKEGDDIKIYMIVTGLLPDERSGTNRKEIPLPELGDDYGYILDPEFKEYLYDQYINSHEIEYNQSRNEYGNTYNAAMTIRDENGEPVADLTAGISLEFIERTMRSYLINLLIITIVLGALFIFSIMQWLNIRVLRPVKKIEQAAVDFEARSQKEKNPDAFVLDMPKLKSGDELESLANTLGNMSLSMKSYAEELLESAVKVDILELDLEESRKKAMRLSELATKDALTGIRNKTAYSQEVENIKIQMAAGNKFFGVAMIDMNDLKYVNDTFGHEKGDIAIKKLCKTVCEVFEHSPVFRVGGDEFVVILRGTDYDNALKLTKKFSRIMGAMHIDATLPEWERINAAVGYAIFDEIKDYSYEDVFERADKKMYDNKAETKKKG